ncbi:MAG: Ig-like domain-containing protein [Firmicutes bacterium]|nr:Ig-like domain-containing protein [Bacillota bacterium]
MMKKKSSIFTVVLCLILAFGVFLTACRKPLREPPPHVTGITVKTPPDKVSYNSGETFAPAGLVITAALSDGTSKDVAYAAEASAFTFTPSLSTILTSATQNVTITYGGQSVQQAITVTAPPTTSLASIAINQPHPQTVYAEGEFFNPANLEITATMSNSTTQVFTYAANAAGFSFNPNLTTALTPLNDKITVTYTHNGTARSADLPITVNAESAQLSSITVSGDFETEYFEGAAFNPSGLVVTAHYEGGATQDVTAQATLSNNVMPAFNPSLAVEDTDGIEKMPHNVTVTYQEGGVTETANIAVKVLELDADAIAGFDMFSEFADGYVSALTLQIGGTDGLATGAGHQITDMLVAEPHNKANQPVTDNLVWDWESSDPTIVALSEEDAGGGIIVANLTALKAGTAIITVTAENGVSAQVEVTVRVMVLSVALTNAGPIALSIDKDGVAQTEQLNYEFTTASNLTPSDNNVTFSVTTGTAVSVSDTGLITAAADGAATVRITAANHGHPKTADITVNVTVAATGVTLTGGNATLHVNPISPQIDTHTLTAQVSNHAAASNTNIVWTVRNAQDEDVTNIAAVIGFTINNGTVEITAKTVGVFTVRAAAADDSTVYEEVTITVPYIPVSSVSITPLTLNFDLTDNFAPVQALAHVVPANASDYIFAWTIHDSSVANVIEIGDTLTGDVISGGTDGSSVYVKPLNAGSAVLRLTVTCAENSTVHEYNRTVNVAAAPILVDDISIRDALEAPLTAGLTLYADANGRTAENNTAQFTYVLDPADATQLNIVWSTSNAAVITVDQDGLVTVVGVGTANVIVTDTVSGEYDEYEITVAAVAVASIAFAAFPDNVYTEGNVLNTQNLRLTVTFNDGSVDNNVAVDSFTGEGRNISLRLADNTEVNSSYQLKIGDTQIFAVHNYGLSGAISSAAQALTVNYKEVASIELLASPNVEYYAGNLFNPEGLEIKVVYNNGDEEIIEITDKDVLQGVSFRFGGAAFALTTPLALAHGGTEEVGGIQVGKFIVRFTTDNTTDTYAELRLTLTVKVPVEEIELGSADGGIWANNTLRLAANGSAMFKEATVSATVLPAAAAQGVVWSTDALASMATIDPATGKITLADTAAATDTFTVTVTAADTINNPLYGAGAITAFFSVEVFDFAVSDDVQIHNSLNADITAQTLYGDIGDTFTFAAFIDGTDVNRYASILWEADGAAVTVSSPNLTGESLSVEAESSGTVTVRLTVKTLEHGADAGFVKEVTLIINTRITASPLTGVITPIGNAAPSTDIDNGTGFTAALVWEGNPATFDYSTAYTAEITLTAATGYTFKGVFADTAAIAGFTVNGNAPEFVSNSGTQLVFTVTFPETSNDVQPVDAAPITGVVAPAVHAAPSTAINNGTGFTAALAWTDGAFTGGGNFGFDTAYTATITLTAAATGIIDRTFASYTDTASIAGFTVHGIAPVWVSNNAGTLVFTVTFPLTDAAINAAAPEITTHPLSGSVDLGGTRVLTVEATSPDGGELSYQWYSNTSASNSGGAPIADATSNTYSVPANADNTYYYYVEVTNTNTNPPINNITIATTPSNVATVTVVDPNQAASIRWTWLSHWLRTGNLLGSDDSQTGETADNDNRTAANYTLTGHADASATAGTPFAPADRALVGAFNGGGFEIRNLNATGGLFANMNNANSRVENLTFVNPVINATGTAGLISNFGRNGQINNITVKNLIFTTTAAVNAGALIGWNDDAVMSFTNCNVEVVFESTGSSDNTGVGGFVGLVYRRLDFTDCTIDVTFKDSGTNRGGLAGRVLGGTGIEMSGGKIITRWEAAGGSNIGGVIGLHTQPLNNTFTNVDIEFHYANTVDRMGGIFGRTESNHQNTFTLVTLLLNETGNGYLADQRAIVGDFTNEIGLNGVNYSHGNLIATGDGGIAQSTIQLSRRKNGVTGATVNAGSTHAVTYFATQNFNPAGLVLDVTYAAGMTGPATVAYTGNEGDFTFTPALNVSLTPAVTQITVSYHYQTIIIPITVTPISVTSIAITSMPTKLDYFENEAFDLTGLVIQPDLNFGSVSAVTYNSDIADQFTVSLSSGGAPLAGLPSDTTAVWVGYQGAWAQITGITVETPIPVTGITVTGDEVTGGALELPQGRTAQLSAEVAPIDADIKTVTWVSSNPSFATVSADGLVTAVAEGTTVITATTVGLASDGQPRTATVTVTVTARADEPIPDDGRTVAEVSTWAEFRAALNVNQHVYLLNDITMPSEEPAWTAANFEFTHILEGNNKSLIDFRLDGGTGNNGLFTNLGVQSGAKAIDRVGRVQNLTLLRPVMTAGNGTNVGFIAGRIWQGERMGYINNVHMKDAVIHSTANGPKGGFVGFMNDRGELILDNSSFEGTIYGNGNFQNFGGAIGLNTSGYLLSRNFVLDITLNDSAAERWGGLIGSVQGDSNIIIIENLNATVRITGTAGNNRQGGLFGEITQAPNQANMTQSAPQATYDALNSGRTRVVNGTIQVTAVVDIEITNTNWNNNDRGGIVGWTIASYGTLSGSEGFMTITGTVYGGRENQRFAGNPSNIPGTVNVTDLNWAATRP